MKKRSIHKLWGTHKSRRFLIVSLFVLSQFTTIACRCEHLTKTFMTSLSSFTAHVEVVQIDTLSATGIYRSWPLVLTKLKVIKPFIDSTDVQFVWMYSASGTDCEAGLFPDHISQQYVVTGTIYKDLSKRFDTWIDDAATRNFLHVSTCGKTILQVEGTYVFGEITKNNENEIRAKYDRLMKEDEVKAMAYYKEIYYTKHHKDRIQKIPLIEFYEIMKP